MKSKIFKIILFTLPASIFILLYIKNKLTKLLSSDIFDISLNEDEEENF